MSEANVTTNALLLEATGSFRLPDDHDCYGMTLSTIDNM